MAPLVHRVESEAFKNRDWRAGVLLVAHDTKKEGMVLDCVTFKQIGTFNMYAVEDVNGACWWVHNTSVFGKDTPPGAFSAGKEYYRLVGDGIKVPYRVQKLYGVCQYPATVERTTEVAVVSTQGLGLEEVESDGEAMIA